MLRRYPDHRGPGDPLSVAIPSEFGHDLGQAQRLGDVALVGEGRPMPSMVDPMDRVRSRRRWSSTLPSAGRRSPWSWARSQARPSKRTNWGRMSRSRRSRTWTTESLVSWISCWRFSSSRFSSAFSRRSRCRMRREREVVHANPANPNPPRLKNHSEGARGAGNEVDARDGLLVAQPRKPKKEDHAPEEDLGEARQLDGAMQDRGGADAIDQGHESVLGGWSVSSSASTGGDSAADRFEGAISEETLRDWDQDTGLGETGLGCRPSSCVMGK